jgi:hypothetical protein
LEAVVRALEEIRATHHFALPTRSLRARVTAASVTGRSAFAGVRLRSDRYLGAELIRGRAYRNTCLKAVFQ